MTDARILIIGTGIEGTMAAYRLSQLFGPEGIFAVDKNENFPGENQSSRSSGVIHAGIYYRQKIKNRNVSPFKAASCVAGNKWWLEDFGPQYPDVPLLIASLFNLGTFI